MSPATTVRLVSAVGAAPDSVHAIHFGVAPLARHLVGPGLPIGDCRLQTVVRAGLSLVARLRTGDRSGDAEWALTSRGLSHMDQGADRAGAAEWADERARMVIEQLERRGIHDPRVLEAMRRVPRHLFVRHDQQSSAYDDRALPIGEGQTISQPYMVAVMTEALAVPESGRVLEIGTGSGYQAAVLAQLAREVITIERRPDLAEIARRRLASLGYANVRVIVADGSAGYPEASPYDGIMVTAGAPQVPMSMQAQLADRRRLVVPVGSAFHQDLVVIERSGETFTQTRGDGCVFVPLLGQEGWPES